jgi:hypothetical protein
MVGDAQLADLPRPARLGDLALPHWQRPERARLELGAQVVQEPGNAGGSPDRRGRQAVDAVRVRSGVARDPCVRHGQRRRIVHEVEQVIVLPLCLQVFLAFAYADLAEHSASRQAGVGGGHRRQSERSKTAARTVAAFPDRLDRHSKFGVASERGPPLASIFACEPSTVETDELASHTRSQVIRRDASG